VGNNLVTTLPKFKEFANYLVWNQSPDAALADMNSFLVHLMARCPEGAFRYAKENFDLTNADFIEALRNSSPGEFIYESNWDKWNVILGLDPPMPYPRKHPDATLF
jgi:hypothetical protein